MNITALIVLVVWFFSFDGLLKYWGAKKTLSLYFALHSVAYSGIALFFVLRLFGGHYASLLSRALLITGEYAVLAAIYGMAWRTEWMGKPSAKRWGIVASSSLILFPIYRGWLSFHHSRSLRICSMIMIGTGAIGLVTFLRRGEQGPRDERRVVGDPAPAQD